MSQIVKCLTWKLKNLSSDLQYSRKKLGVVAHGSNPNTEEMGQEASLSLLPSQFCLIGDL